MPQVRLVQPGYESFTGELGHITFSNGVSVDQEPNPDFVRSLRGIVQLENVTVAAAPDAPPTGTPGVSGGKADDIDENV